MSKTFSTKRFLFGTVLIPSWKAAGLMSISNLAFFNKNSSQIQVGKLINQQFHVDRCDFH